jgi:hypothetical protein
VELPRRADACGHHVRHTCMRAHGNGRTSASSGRMHTRVLCGQPHQVARAQHAARHTMH